MKDRSTLNFDELYNEFSKLVFHIAYSMIKDFHLAEDIMQEVFVKLDKNMDMFHNKEHVKAWLIKVASNESKDYLKKHGETELSHQPFDDEVCKSLYLDTIEDSIEFWDAQNRIDKIFRKLYKKNKRWYQLMVEVLYGNKTTEELSAIFHINNNAVTSLKYRVRQWLKAELMKQNQELKYAFDKFLGEDENKKVDERNK